MLILQSALGLVAFTAAAWLLSENRAAFNWRLAAVGLGMQLIIALMLFRFPPARAFFVTLNHAVLALQQATDAGTSFVFGYLGGGPLPFEETEFGGSVIFAFRALPIIIVMSALTALLTYWRILPFIVGAFSSVFRRTLGVSGPVSLAAAANVFVGMVEAPLFIRSYLKQLGRGELYMVMCVGMATIAGTVLVLYTTVLGPVIDDAAGHLVAASIISAPAAIMVARIMIPPTERSGDVLQAEPFPATSAMDAITIGTQRGLTLYLNIVAMLIVLVALVQLLNSLLAFAPGIGEQPITLQRALGWVMAPIVWLMGVPWAESATAGSLMGVKTVLNEFLAYLQLADMGEEELGSRTRLIMTYALCGMANLGSAGIMIGGFTVLIPDRRQEITSLALKSIVGGTIATCLTGAVVGVVVG